MKPICLTIAGFESSGVAGIQTDIKTIIKSDVFPVGNLTCIVNIMPNGEHNFTPIAPNIINDAIESAHYTHNISAVKIGMLGTNKTIEIVAKRLKETKLKNIVLDPVLICKDEVSSEILNTAEILKDKLFSLAKIVTPNLFEAGIFSGSSIPKTEKGVISAGKKILLNGPEYVLIKGLKIKNKITDYLISKSNVDKFTRQYEKVEKINGAGCSISSKIAAELSKGLSVSNAVQNAHKFITIGIKNNIQKTNTNLSTL